MVKCISKQNLIFLLADHDIRIPKIVKYNIAEVINVDVKGKLLSKE